MVDSAESAVLHAWATRSTKTSTIQNHLVFVYSFSSLLPLSLRSEFHCPSARSAVLEYHEL